MKYRTKLLDTTELILQHKDDLDVLDYHCFPEDALYDKIKGEKYGKRGSHVWWLTYEVKTKRPVAFAGLKIYSSSTNAYFCRAGVRDKYRGEGLHKKLLQKRLKWCEENGIYYAYSYTSYDNYASVNNLVKYGFKLGEPWFETDIPKELIFTYKKIDG